MDSVWLGFLSKSQEWKERADAVRSMVSTKAARGLEVYAVAREKMWLKLANDARAEFQRVGIHMLDL